MLDAFFDNKAEIQFLIMGLIAALAFWKGAAPERAVAGSLVYMHLIDPPYHWLIGEAKYDQIDLGHLFIDATTAALLFTIALRANRTYPLWLAAWQLISVFSHIVRNVSPAIAKNAYAIMIIAPSYFEIAIFAVGLLLHLRREKIFGPYRSWLGSSNPSPAPGLPR